MNTSPGCTSIPGILLKPSFKLTRAWISVRVLRVTSLSQRSDSSDPPNVGGNFVFHRCVSTDGYIPGRSREIRNFAHCITVSKLTSDALARELPVDTGEIVKTDS